MLNVLLLHMLINKLFIHVIIEMLIIMDTINGTLII